MKINQYVLVIDVVYIFISKYLSNIKNLRLSKILIMYFTHLKNRLELNNGQPINKVLLSLFNKVFIYLAY